MTLWYFSQDLSTGHSRLQIALTRLSLFRDRVWGDVNSDPQAGDFAGKQGGETESSSI